MSFIIPLRQIWFRSLGVGTTTDANFGGVDNLVDNVVDQLVDNRIGGVAVYIGTGEGVRGGVLRSVETAIFCLCLLGKRKVRRFSSSGGV